MYTLQYIKFHLNGNAFEVCLRNGMIEIFSWLICAASVDTNCFSNTGYKLYHITTRTIGPRTSTPHHIGDHSAEVYWVETLLTNNFDEYETFELFKTRWNMNNLIYLRLLFINCCMQNKHEIFPRNSQFLFHSNWYNFHSNLWNFLSNIRNSLNMIMAFKSINVSFSLRIPVSEGKFTEKMGTANSMTVIQSYPLIY